MKRRFAFILGLAALTSILFLSMHQIVVGQNGGSQGSGQSDVTNGLLGWWAFDEGHGTNTFERTGTGRTGTLIGSPLPAWTSGVSSNALEFDGFQNNVLVPNDAGLTPADALTLSTWVKVGSNTSSEAIAKWLADNSGGSYALSLTNGLPELDLSLGGSVVRLTGTIALIGDQWHHIAATYDGTQIQLYVDGFSAGKLTASGAIDSVEAPLTLGLVAGRMDDVRIYGRALSSNEISSVYAALAGGINNGSTSNDAVNFDQTGTNPGATNSQENIDNTNPPQTNAQTTITSNPPAVLENPGFEFGDIPPGHASTGWTNFGENGPNVFHESLLPKSGFYHLKVFGAFTGPTNESGAYQDLPAQYGQTWRASAYVMSPANDQIRCTSSARVELEFLDSSTNLLSSPINSAEFDGDDLKSEYRLLAATGTAPAGTAYARILCVFEQRWQTPGAVFFDDADLSMQTMSATTNCQAFIPDLTSMASVSAGASVRQVPPAGTLVSFGTTNISLLATNAAGKVATYALPLTVVRDALPIVSAPTPMLANSSFESGDGPRSHVIDHWTGFGVPPTNLVNAFQVPYVPHSGAFVAKLFQEFNVATNYTGLYQELPAAGGETWYAGSYIWLPADDSIAGANKARVRLEFYNAEHALLGKFDSSVLTAYSPQDVWIPMGIWGKAPSETAYARIVCLFEGDGTSTGSAYFDDAVLTKLIVPIDGSCQTAVLPDLTASSAASDGCGNNYNVRQDPGPGSVIPTGVTSVMLTSRDEAGNNGHYRVAVAVVDTNVPVFAITSADSVCPFSPSNTSSVASIAGATYVWSIKNGTLIAGQGTPNVIWQAGAAGWSVLSVVMTTPAGCAYSNWKGVTAQCAQGWFDSTEATITNSVGGDIYSTNLTSSTSSNGISDYEQAYLALINPASSNFNGIVTDVAVKNGAAISAHLGSWQIDGSEIYALDRRGSVDYRLVTTSADVFRVLVEGREQDSQTNSSSFDLQVYVDGEYLGRQTLQATATTYGAIRLYTPFLQRGTHTVRVFWDNAASNTSLRLKDVRLQILGGPDSNGNGIKDWVESRLQTMCGFDPVLPVTSYVSPFCAEGRERFLSMMTISTLATNLAPSHSPSDRWYANIPLSVATNTTVVVSYQNGGLLQTGLVQWVAKNILDGGTMSIRQGDNLMLTAAPNNVTDGAENITVQNGSEIITQYTGAAASPLVVAFPSTGSYSISGVFNSSTQAVAGKLTVNVISHAFTSNPAVWVGKPRNWSVPVGNVVLDGDPRLMMVPLGAPTNDVQNYTLVIDQNEPRYVVSRLWSGGPIVSGAHADGLRLFTTPDTYIEVLQRYADGSRLDETLEVLSPPVPDVTVQIIILVGGVTFEDGTIYKELTVADFDALGQYKLHLLLPAGLQTASCHRIQIVQGADLVGVHH